MKLLVTSKGGPESGWYAPPKGTHTGEKHRAVGSGQSAKPQDRGNRVAGDVVFGHDKIERSQYGQTKGQQLSRRMEVRKGMQIIVYIRQLGKGTPFWLEDLRGGKVSMHESLRKAKAAARDIADRVEYESDIPGLGD